MNFGDWRSGAHWGRILVFGHWDLVIGHSRPASGGSDSPVVIPDQRFPAAPHRPRCWRLAGRAVPASISRASNGALPTSDESSIAPRSLVG